LLRLWSSYRSRDQLSYLSRSCCLLTTWCPFAVRIILAVASSLGLSHRCDTLGRLLHIVATLLVVFFSLATRAVPTGHSSCCCCCSGTLVIPMACAIKGSHTTCGSRTLVGTVFVVGLRWSSMAPPPVVLHSFDRSHHTLYASSSCWFDCSGHLDRSLD